MASIHLYFARKQVGDTPKRGKPEMRLGQFSRYQTTTSDDILYLRASAPQCFLLAVTPDETIEGLVGILCGTTRISLKEIFAGQAQVDSL